MYEAFAILLVYVLLPVTFLLAGCSALCACYALWVAVHAWRARALYHDGRKIVCSFLALSLGEALWNGSVITMVAFQYDYMNTILRAPLTHSLRLSSPMIVLATPVFGLLLRNPMYRRQCVLMVGVGLLRWLIVLLAWGSYGSWSGSNLLGVIIPNLCFIGGTILLWRYTRWAREVLQEYQLQT